MGLVFVRKRRLEEKQEALDAWREYAEQLRKNWSKAIQERDALQKRCDQLTHAIHAAREAFDKAAPLVTVHIQNTV